MWCVKRVVVAVLLQEGGWGRTDGGEVGGNKNKSCENRSAAPGPADVCCFSNGPRVGLCTCVRVEALYVRFRTCVYIYIPSLGVYSQMNSVYVLSIGVYVVFCRSEISSEFE